MNNYCKFEKPGAVALEKWKRRWPYDFRN